jgi:hypothetical protein
MKAGVQSMGGSGGHRKVNPIHVLRVWKLINVEPIKVFVKKDFMLTNQNHTLDLVLDLLCRMKLIEEVDAYIPASYKSNLNAKKCVQGWRKIK